MINEVPLQYARSNCFFLFLVVFTPFNSVTHLQVVYVSVKQLFASEKTERKKFTRKFQKKRKNITRKTLGKKKKQYKIVNIAKAPNSRVREFKNTISHTLKICARNEANYQESFIHR